MLKRQKTTRVLDDDEGGAASSDGGGKSDEASDADAQQGSDGSGQADLGADSQASRTVDAQDADLARMESERPPGGSLAEAPVGSPDASSEKTYTSTNSKFVQMFYELMITRSSE